MAFPELFSDERLKMRLQPCFHAQVLWHVGKKLELAALCAKGLIMSVVLRGFTQLGCLQPPCLFYRDGFDTSIGTLWWVATKLWREKVPDYGITEKKSHPGLSVSMGNHHQRRSYAHMLHGTSERRNGTFIVKGMTKKDPEYLTYFGRLKPVRIEVNEFTPATTEFQWDDPGWTEKTRIIWNRDKLRITDEEFKQLELWHEAIRRKQHWNRGKVS